MEYINLSISSKESKFYQKSKEPQDGYVKVLYGPDKDKVTYHKYQSSAKGVPTSFSQKNIEHGGTTLRFLEVTLYDEESETQTKISCNLRTPSGYTEEARKIISVFNGVEPNRPISVSITPNSYTSKAGKKVETFNLYGNYLDENGENGKPKTTGFIPYADLPPGEKKTVAGDVVWDFTKQTEFYYDKITEISQRFATSGLHKKPEADKTKEKEEEYSDDLPF